MIFRARDITLRDPRWGLVLDNISFGLERGEWLGIAGPSGAGKSTLARCLCGLEGVKHGSVTVKNQQFSLQDMKDRRSLRKNVQMVFQDPYLSFPPHLPVRFPLMDACRLLNRQNRGCAGILSDLMAELGLSEELLSRVSSELSGGQRQRMAIARALVVSPEVLIVDEVTSALDLITQNRLLSLLNALREHRSMSIIFISHDLGLLLATCQRILVLQDGRIVEEGLPREIRQGPKTSITMSLLSSIPARHPKERKLLVQVRADWIKS
jgi:peptide/nickel transport system ATP-binding protein